MKVLIAVDGSFYSECTLDWYFTRLHKPTNEVVVYHNVVKAELSEDSFAGCELATRFKFVGQTYEEIVKNEPRTTNARYRNIYDQTQISCKVVVDKGDGMVGQNILNCAAAENVDAIITGCRTKGMITRALLGNASEFVVTNAKIPVFVCPHK